jgi:hypothetical protein
MGRSRPTGDKTIEALVDVGMIEKIPRFDEEGRQGMNDYVLLEVKKLEGGGGKKFTPPVNTLFTRTKQRKRKYQRKRRKSPRACRDRPISRRG